MYSSQLVSKGHCPVKSLEVVADDADAGLCLNFELLACFTHLMSPPKPALSSSFQNSESWSSASRECIPSSTQLSSLLEPVLSPGSVVLTERVSVPLPVLFILAALCLYVLSQANSCTFKVYIKRFHILIIIIFHLSGYSQVELHILHVCGCAPEASHAEDWTRAL